MRHMGTPTTACVQRTEALCIKRSMQSLRPLNHSKKATKTYLEHVLNEFRTKPSENSGKYNIHELMNDTKTLGDRDMVRMLLINLISMYTIY